MTITFPKIIHSFTIEYEWSKDGFEQAYVRVSGINQSPKVQERVMDIVSTHLMSMSADLADQGLDTPVAVVYLYPSSRVRTWTRQGFDRDVDKSWLRRRFAQAIRDLSSS